MYMMQQCGGVDYTESEYLGSSRIITKMFKIIKKYMINVGSIVSGKAHRRSDQRLALPDESIHIVLPYLLGYKKVCWLQGQQASDTLRWQSD